MILTHLAEQFALLDRGFPGIALASRRRKAPGFALLGEPGETADVVLELKTLADVALIGFPSAGKSSLVSVVSAAKPKIADYPFTTLVPNLGVVSASDHSYTVADVPGLIPGASEGRGLGLDFLRHIERCAVLVHVVDCATMEPGRDPISDIDALEAELAAYQPTLQGDSTLGDLADRPRAVLLNKIDVPDARELADFVRDEVAEKYGWPVYEISTVSRDGLRPLTFALWDLVAAYRAAQPEVAPRRAVIRPIAVDETGFTVTPDGQGGFAQFDHILLSRASRTTVAVIGPIAMSTCPSRGGLSPTPRDLTLAGATLGQARVVAWVAGTFAGVEMLLLITSAFVAFLP